VLTIRSSQKKVLADAAFERWLVKHARRFFPEQCRTLGESGTRTFVREMASLARGYGLTEGPDISRFIDLTFAFGANFERLPWADRIVSQAGRRWSEFTVDALFEAALMAEAAETAARAAEPAQ
jgi:hypothetical protein